MTDPGRDSLSLPLTPIGWPISSLEQGDLGTGQVQTAELQAMSPGTAWAAHGNYGVEYDITLPLVNNTSRRRSVVLALESPIKSGSDEKRLLFSEPPKRSVMFRGPVEVRGLDGFKGGPTGRRIQHLVLRQGLQGPELGRVTLDPGEGRRVRVRLIYPADATPPQVLSVLPVKQSTPTVSVGP